MKNFVPLSSTKKLKSKKSPGSGITGSGTGLGSGSGTGTIPTGNIPASSGSTPTNTNPGLSRPENIDSLAPNTDPSRKSKKKNSPARRDNSDMDEAHRLAEAKAEELRIQAERALKQQEDDEREEEERRRLDNRFYNPGGSVFLNAQVKIVWTLHIMIYSTLRTSYMLLVRFRGVIRLLLHMFHHLYLLRLMS
jgi:hypothetical protein